ncbi:MAG: hypothetical protein ORN22_08035 [Opitutales bacterium]|nr:hypothetical protein [Opitutales bacterium]
MSSAPDDGETYKLLVVKGAGVGKPSDLKLKVEVRRDDIALVVKVDGMKLTAETCVTCPLGLVSILGGPEKRKNFTCDCGDGRCSSGRIPHSFNVERRGDELIWSRTNYPAGSSSVSFDHHQACVAVCEALLELKSAVDAHPKGIDSCAGMMPGKFTYEELLSCIEQSKLMVAKGSKPVEKA